jgi:hypothetical protein
MLRMLGSRLNKPLLILRREMRALLSLVQVGHLSLLVEGVLTSRIGVHTLNREMIGVLRFSVDRRSAVGPGEVGRLRYGLRNSARILRHPGFY